MIGFVLPTTREVTAAAAVRRRGFAPWRAGALGMTLAWAGVTLNGCGGEAPLNDSLASVDEDATLDDELPSGDPDGSSNDPAEALPDDLESALERESLAPGYRQLDYPAAPYGFVTGSVIPNFEFLGWYQPVAANHELSALDTLSIADFFDSDGGKGIELLMINAVAVWCSVCQIEYMDLRDSEIYSTFRARGLEILGVLFEDADALPAQYSDLQNWSRAFDVEFPFVLDPGFKMGAFFDRSATPMNMVVDARTMQVLDSRTGYDPRVFEFIDLELTKRGR